MIYEAVAADLEAVAAQLDELQAALDRLRAEAVAAGQPVAAGQLLALSARTQAQAAGFRAQSQQVAAQPGLAAALQFGLTALQNAQVFVRNDARPTFDNAVQPLAQTGERARCDALITGLDELATADLQELEEAGTFPAGPSFNIARLRSTVDDLASYPILTSDGGGFPSIDGPMGGGTVTVQRTVDSAVRQVLGRLPKYTDAKAFVAALSASFELTEVQGHTITSWRPRGYVGQTELGGSVSGAQASLYARARDALGAAVPVLHGLTPLRPDADLQEVEAARGMVEAEFRAVVDELGTEGGPRGQRVDQLFAILLTQNVVGIGNRVVAGGMIGYISDVFGLDAGQVNTVEEEQDFSNFLLLRDYITTIQASWTAFQQQFFGRDLGTRLVLLSNALQVVAESVDEVVAALDSVFVGRAEQTVASFSVGPGQSMLVSELLTWVSSFAAQEAPELVQQGGRRSMGAVQTTATRLDGLVGRLLVAIGGDFSLPEGMRHPRVRHPLTELQSYLQRVVQLAADVQIA